LPDAKGNCLPSGGCRLMGSFPWEAGHTVDVVRRCESMSDVPPPVSLIGLGDADGVGSLIRQPHLSSGRPIEALGAGMDSVAWLIDAEWVGRFPVTADARATVETELALLPLLDDAPPVPARASNMSVATPTARR
jgi:hypothetical protein